VQVLCNIAGWPGHFAAGNSDQLGNNLKRAKGMLTEDGYYIVIRYDVI
jgi:hypothetical protein